jgi:hypothetical protein
MKKIKLLLILLFSTLTTQAQYYPDFSVMSFYNQTSGKQDLHFNDGWTRDTNSITLTNSNIRIRLRTGTTHYVQTGLLDLKKNDVISFNHRKTNSSGSGKVKVSYVDSAGNITDIKTITYSSSNTLNDTIKVSVDKKVRVRFTFTKLSGNNNTRFEISSFSAVGLIILPIKPTVERPQREIEVIEDEVLIYNIFGVCVYEGYLSDFYQIAEKGQVYFTNKKKFVVY